jgi:uncharacterized protein
MKKIPALMEPAISIGIGHEKIMPFVSQLADETVVVRLHVQPKASKTKVVGFFDGCLKLDIHAPPVDGKANDEVLRFLAGLLARPLRDLSLKSGMLGRRKRVLIRGMTVAEVRIKIASQLVVKP